MAGKKMKVDNMVTVALDCKYMGGWTYDDYLRQPIAFTQVVTMLRQAESEEALKQK